MVHVVRHVRRGLGLEVARQAVGVGAVEHGIHQRRTEPLALPVGMGGEEVEVPVRLGRRVGHHHVAQRVEPRQPPRGMVGDRTDVDIDLGSPRRHPRRNGDGVVGRPRVPVGEPSDHRDPEHTAPVTLVLLVVRVQPAQDRIVGERPHRRQAQAGHFGRGRQMRSGHQPLTGVRCKRRYGHVGLPAAFAHGLQPVAAAGALELVEQRGHQPGTGGAERVAERDRTAVDVDLLAVEVGLRSQARTTDANASLISTRSMSSPTCPSWRAPAAWPGSGPTAS